eukprot:TRINITY_DN2898_c0_g1_i2.p1 TRINITY_DN2898_c0_g1~~TRINITY_DN2898_c0_g1_i2.p1  ORF type:complete len:297 (+),score=51.60 TRINITY_DN2898_c0_g1_i2:85-975(+)
MTGCTQKALSAMLVAHFARSIFGARTVSTMNANLEGDAPGCFAIHVRGICIPVTQHLTEGLSAHAARKAPELKCLKPWCDEGKQTCCDVYDALVEKFSGPRDSLLKKETYEGFMWALGMDGSAGEAPKPRRVRTPPRPVQITKPMKVDRTKGSSDAKPAKTEPKKPAAPVAKPAVEKASSNSSGKSKNCFCSAGVGGINQGSFALYAKSNWKVKGPEGKACTEDTSCKLCSRDGSPCCEQNADGTMGECGARVHTKAVDWKGAKCLCGGLFKQKSTLCQTPEQKCNECSSQCYDVN